MKRRQKKRFRKRIRKTEDRFAFCVEGKMTICSPHVWDWWVGERPNPHISHVFRDMAHLPGLLIGLYVEGPIRSGSEGYCRTFVDLCNNTAYSLINGKGETLLLKEMGMKALSSPVVTPIIKRRMKELTPYLDGLAEN